MILSGFAAKYQRAFRVKILISKEIFEQSRVMLLVDAFDEIPEPETRKKILQFLVREFKPQYPRTRLICVSRPGRTS